MKKKVLNAAQVLKIKNAFSPEGQAAADALIEAIEAMGAEDQENGVEELAAKVTEILESLKQVPEPVQEYIHNAIEQRFKTVANIASVKGVKPEVRNEVINAVMGYRGKDAEGLKATIDAICVKNGISGLTYGDIIDYELVDKFGKEDRLYSMFHQTRISRFFYSEADMSTAAAIAKQWDKGSQVAKDIQALDVTPKTITTDYVYVRQQVAQSDLDEVVRSNSQAEFIGYITELLQRVVINTIVMAILVGDAVNASGKKIVVFETIAKNTTDAFTRVVTAAAAVPTVTEVRTQADLLLNPRALKKVAVMSAATKTSLAGYVYAAGGDTYYRSDEELAGQLGVDEIYTTDLMNGKGVIVMLPEEYFILDKNTIEVAYPTWEHNVQNWQYEKNIGGKIHGLLSTAYIKPGA